MRTRRIAAVLSVVALDVLGTTAIAAQENVAKIVGQATAAITPMRDSAVLHKAGYFAIGFNGAVKDLTPFQGQHWLHVARFFANPAIDLATPNFFMYLPIGDSLIPIGVAYSHRVNADSTLPADLAGTAADWHSHIFCRNIPGEGNTLADGADDCKERHGVAAPNQIAMIHTWTVPNPDGPFAHDNPALPYIAVGLKPPPHAMRDERLLGVALGESYGARLVAAHRINIMTDKAGVAALDARRATLRSLATQLRDAERANDAPKFKATQTKVLDEWTALAADYRRLAPSPEMRARFDLELNQALGAVAHHHM